MTDKDDIRALASVTGLPEPDHETDPLTDLQARMLKYIKVEHTRNGERLWLAIGPQFFRFEAEPESRRHAAWFARQIAIALARAVEESR